MRIKKLLCTLITISMLSTNMNISAFASESPQPTKTEETQSALDETSDTETPDNKNSNTETPDSQNSNIETPDNKNSNTDSSNIEESDTETSNSETSDTKASDTKESDTETSNSETSNTESTNTETTNTEETTNESTTETDISSEENSNEENSSEELTESEETSSLQETETETELETADISIINDNLSVEAANGLGSLLMDELQIAAQEGQNEAQANYAISEIEMSGKTAQVSLHISSPCTVVVSIYEENSNKPLGFGSATAEIGENKISVPIEIDTMPEYFIVKGHIVESNTLRPLSKEYESGMYTQEMQEFLKKTTDDFDSDKVLNLDDDKKTNFIVVNDNNALITASKDNNNTIINQFAGYDETANTYTFQNIDEQIKNLKKDDIFVFRDNNNANIIFTIKVESIETQETTDNGTVAVIKASEDELNIEDVFSYIKIEETVGNATASEVDPDSCPTGVTYLGRDTATGYAEQGDLTLSYAPDRFALDFNEINREGTWGPIKLEGEIEAGLSLEAEVKYYFALFDLFDTWYVDISFTGGVTVEGTISAELDKPFDIPLCAAVEIETNILTITYVPKFVINISFEGSYQLEEKVTIGVRLGNLPETGFYFQPELNLNELNAEISGYIGIDFNPKLKLIDILNCELKTGVHLGAEASVSSADPDHECGLLCISGDFFFDIPFEGELKIPILGAHNIHDLINFEDTQTKFSFGEFYYSIKHKELGWGECPYRGNTEITIFVQDAEKNPIQNAVVTTNNGTESVKTDVNGCAKIKAARGEQCFFATYTKSGTITRTGSISYNVGEDEMKPVITLGSMNAKLPKSQKVAKLKCSSYNSVYDEYWMAIMEDGSLYTWGRNDNGIIGNGSTTSRSNPVKVLENVKEIAVESKSSNKCVAAISYDGELYMWGSNKHGQLGLGQTAKELPNVTVPTIVPIHDKIKKVSIAGETVAAITENNELYMWGSDNNGRLGTDDGVNDYKNPINNDLNTPTKIMDGVSDVKISQYNTMVLSISGAVYIWGEWRSDMLGDGSDQYRSAPDLTNPIADNAKYITLSNTNAAVITEDGSLYMWGKNNYGQLGINSIQNSHKKIQTTNISDVNRVILLADNCVAAITANGSLYMWGKNSYGQLGDETTENKTSPYKVSQLQNVTYISNHSNYNVTTAITQNHEIWQWGMRTKNMKVEKILANTQSFMHIYDYYYIAMTDGSLWYSYMPNERSLTFTPFTDVSDTLQQNLYTLQPDEYINQTTNTDITPYALSDYKSLKTFTDLIPGELYNFYAMKSRTASAPLDNYNMLSIAQGTADDNGELTVNFTLRENYNTPDLFVVGQTRYDITDLSKIEVTGVDDLTYNGKEQYINPIVTYNGKQLNEGTDYYLSGDYKATEIGSYTVIIVGTGIYNGAVAADYRINPILHTVTFDSDGGSEIESQLVEDGQFAQEPEPPIKDKYRFTGWYLNGRLYNFASTKVTQDITLTAHWEAMIPLTAPTADLPSDSKIENGTKITLHCQTADATIYYTLDGTDPTKESTIYQEPIIITKESDGAITLKAFASKEGWLDSDIVSFTYHVSVPITGYVITFDSDGGTPVESQFITIGEKATEPDIPFKEGFRFIGWYLDDNLYDFTSEVTKDMTLKAHWEEQAMLNAPTANIPSGKTVAKGTNIILTCTEPEAIIYYTTDESEPTKQSEIYQKPITITDHTTIKAFAAKEGFRNSDIVVFSYNVSAGGSEDNDNNDYETVPPDDIPDGNIPEGLWITGIQQSYPYTGTAIKPQARVYNGSRRLQEGRDYTIRYKNNIKASDTASIIVKGKGNYSGTETKAFRIAPIDLNDSRIIAEDLTLGYNKKVQKPVPILTFNGKKLAKNKDFTITYSSIEKGISGANQQIGVYEMELKAKPNSNFTGSRTIQFTITDKTLISKAKVSKIADQTYNNGSECRPSLQVTIKGKAGALIEGQDFTVTYQNNTAIGTATAILTGNGDYAGTKKVTFKITGRSIAKASVSGIENKIFNGSEQTQNISVTLNGTTLIQGSSYQVQYTNNRKAGKATITITGINDCSGTIKKTFQILPFDLAADAQNATANRKVTGLENPLTVKYVKGGAKPVPTLIYQGTSLKLGTDFTISYKNNKKPASYSNAKVPSFTIKGKGNFKGAVTQTFTIESKALNDPESPVTISVPDIGFVDKAGKYISKPVLTDTDGTKLVSGKDYNNIVYTLRNSENQTILTKQDKPAVGTVIYVKVSGTGAYAGGELETSYQIMPMDFSKAKITIKPQEYTGNAVALNKEAFQSVKVGNTDITSQYSTSYEIIAGSYRNNVKKGTASVSIRGIGNYGGTKTIKFKITSKKFGGFLWFWK